MISPYFIKLNFHLPNSYNWDVETRNIQEQVGKKYLKSCKNYNGSKIDLKSNTSAYLNPTSWVFKQFSRKLFNLRSMIVLLLLDKIAPINLIKTL